jgi:putative ABC transport system ATP-binding protein
VRGNRRSSTASGCSIAPILASSSSTGPSLRGSRHAPAATSSDTRSGTLFQNYGLIETWSVDLNLHVAFTGGGVGRRDRETARRIALDRVGLTDAGGRPVDSLSGGEQQRIALARLLLKRPRIVVADEPSTALDGDNVAVVLEVLDELKRSGAAIVVATHDDAVAYWCDDEFRLGCSA